MKRYTFTLIEILGVIAIIGILAALGFAGYSYANGKAKESATKGLITRLDAALEFAKEKSGYLPDSNSKFCKIIVSKDSEKEQLVIKDDNSDFLTVTIPADDDDDVKVKRGSSEKKYGQNSQNGKMYISFYRNFTKTVQMDSMSRFLNENNEIIDAWGNVIYFCYPGKLKTGGFDLISAGSDGVFGSEEKSAPVDDLSKYRSGAEWICDDIVNF